MNKKNIMKVVSYEHYGEKFYDVIYDKCNRSYIAYRLPKTAINFMKGAKVITYYSIVFNRYEQVYVQP